MPAMFRLMFALAMSAGLVFAHPEAVIDGVIGADKLLEIAARELFVGTIFVLGLQLMFGALHFAGRTVDIQAGYGLALLIDPTSRVQTPLVGTLFAYAAGILFFALNGHIDLLRIMSASLDAVPLGAAETPLSLDRLLAFMAAVFTVSLGVAGGVILVMFLTDIAIALLARTAPQLNALMLGFQLKTILLFLALPLSFGASGALLARLARVTLEGLPSLL